MQGSRVTDVEAAERTLCLVEPARTAPGQESPGLARGFQNDSAASQLSAVLSSEPTSSPVRMPKRRRYVIRSKTMLATHSLDHEDVPKIRLNPYLTETLREHAEKILGKGRIAAPPSNELEHVLFFYFDDARAARRFLRRGYYALLWSSALVWWPLLLMLIISPFTQPWQNEIRDKQLVCLLDKVMPPNKALTMMRERDLANTYFDYNMLKEASACYRKATNSQDPKQMSVMEMEMERYKSAIENHCSDEAVGAITPQSAKDFLDNLNQNAKVGPTGDTYSEVTERMNNYARYFASNGHIHEALSIYEKLAADQAKICPDSNEYFNTRHLIANWKREIGKFKESESLYKALMEDCTRHPEGQDAKLAMIQFDYAKCLAASHRMAEAQEMEQSAWKLCNRALD